MEFILVSVKYNEKIDAYLELLKDFTIRVKETQISENDFTEEYLLREHIITLDIEDLVKLRDILNISIILENYYYDSELERHENINVLRIYDGYKE
ncbi:MAG: hypothetical protein ACRC1T_05710 [Clostridium chrysemydis]|uniref:hypothetical protein n=1 Tax=Clostridium chrysemydis TaxID=2665504 RepID=UPI003F325861